MPQLFEYKHINSRHHNHKHTQTNLFNGEKPLGVRDRKFCSPEGSNSGRQAPAAGYLPLELGSVRAPSCLCLNFRLSVLLRFSGKGICLYVCCAVQEGPKVAPPGSLDGSRPRPKGHRPTISAAASAATWTDWRPQTTD